jgi:hypothetical protein
VKAHKDCRRLALDHISHQFLRISSDAVELEVLFQSPPIPCCPAFEMHLLIEYELFERIVRGYPYAVPIVLDQCQSGGEIRLDVSPGSDDEDDDVEDGYAERSSWVDSVFLDGDRVVGWEVGELLVRVATGRSMSPMLTVLKLVLPRQRRKLT